MTTALPTPEMQAKFAEWKRKDAEGTMTLEDYKQVIRALRGDRMFAQAAAASKRTTVKVEGLLDDFLGCFLG
jgi:hypothetical protein